MFQVTTRTSGLHSLVSCDVGRTLVGSRAEATGHLVSSTGEPTPVRSLKLGESEPGYRVQFEPVGRHTGLAVEKVEEPDSPHDHPAARRLERAGYRVVGVHVLACGAYRV